MAKFFLALTQSPDSQRKAGSPTNHTVRTNIWGTESPSTSYELRDPCWDPSAETLAKGRPWKQASLRRKVAGCCVGFPHIPLLGLAWILKISVMLVILSNLYSLSWQYIVRQESKNNFITKIALNQLKIILRSSLVVQRVKELALSLQWFGLLLWRRFSPWHRTLHMPWAWSILPPSKTEQTNKQKNLLSKFTWKLVYFFHQLQIPPTPHKLYHTWESIQLYFTHFFHSYINMNNFLENTSKIEKEYISCYYKYMSNEYKIISDYLRTTINHDQKWCLSLYPVPSTPPHPTTSGMKLYTCSDTSNYMEGFRFQSLPSRQQGLSSKLSSLIRISSWRLQVFPFLQCSVCVLCSLNPHLSLYVSECSLSYSVKVIFIVRLQPLFFFFHSEWFSLRPTEFSMGDFLSPWAPKFPCPLTPCCLRNTRNLD